jgi:hypothetical protein
MTVNLFGRDASFERSAQRISAAFGTDQVLSLRPTREGNTIVVALKGVAWPESEVLAMRADHIEQNAGLPARKWLGLLRGVEVDSLFAVSLITVAGYSVTDTVVVFDRIREQQTTLAALPVVEQVDVAVDATLTRSLYTSLTTLLPLVALIFFGGSTLFWFAVALTVGIAVGSWSSIGVAPTLLPLFARR